MPRISRRRKQDVLRALKSNDVTMTDMARALGVTTGHVSHFLAGRRYTVRLDEGITAYLRDLPIDHRTDAA